MIKVLFVCLGNICRSPLAEAIFLRLVKEKGLENVVNCDSAGTSDYHIGEAPDLRTLSNALKNGLKINHSARQFIQADLEQYDYIIAMDQNNLLNINRLKTDLAISSEKVWLMRDFEEDAELKSKDVPDPYFGGDKGFQNVYEILYRSNRNFLTHLIKTHHLK